MKVLVADRHLCTLPVLLLDILLEKVTPLLRLGGELPIIFGDLLTVILQFLGSLGRTLS
jgi:hypothetical protein